MDGKVQRLAPYLASMIIEIDQQRLPFYLLAQQIYDAFIN